MVFCLSSPRMRAESVLCSIIHCEYDDAVAARRVSVMSPVFVVYVSSRAKKRAAAIPQSPPPTPRDSGVIVLRTRASRCMWHSVLTRSRSAFEPGAHRWPRVVVFINISISLPPTSAHLPYRAGWGPPDLYGWTKVTTCFVKSYGVTTLIVRTDKHATTYRYYVTTVAIILVTGGGSA